MKIAVMYSFHTEAEARSRMADLATRDYSLIVLEGAELSALADFEAVGKGRIEAAGPLWVVIGMKRD